MRKIVYVLLAGMILLAVVIMLTGCSADMSNYPSTNTSGEVEEKVEKVEEQTQEREENVTEQNNNLEIEQNVQEELVVENATEQVQKEKEQTVLEKINSAKEITITESFFSLNKHYDIYIDGKQVANIDGKYINITGDTFTLTDMNSNVLAKEKQIKRWGVKLNRLAHVMDPSGNTDGYIGEEFFNDLFSISKYKFHFYDKNKNEKGYTREQVLSLFYKFNVFNNSGDAVYNIEKGFSLFVDEYSITKVKDSDIQMKDVVFLTCIVDAIRDAEED